MVETTKITDSRYPGTGYPIRMEPWQLKPMDNFYEKLMGGVLDYEYVKEDKTFRDEVVNAIARVTDVLDALQAQAAVVTAQKRLIIAAADLSTIDVANDTLTIKSSTPYEFDFLDGRRVTRVVLAPGDGVRPMDLRFDMIYSDLPYLQGTVFARNETKLQGFHWTGSAWQAVAWDAGWVIDVVQYIPSLLPKLQDLP